MKLLIDTQMLVWMVGDKKRLHDAFKAATREPTTSLYVSAVIAWEYADLLHRGRLPVREPLPELQERFGIEILDLPAEAWRLASQLPHIHGDPVDRMAVAHAIIGGFTLATADRHMRQYPVRTLW